LSGEVSPHHDVAVDVCSEDIACVKRGTVSQLKTRVVGIVEDYRLSGMMGRRKENKRNSRSRKNAEKK
jgi:hypothetical protein